MTLDHLRLGSGRWYVNIAIGEPGMLDRGATEYFALDPGWYHLLAARIELQVSSIGKLDASGCFVVHPAAIAVADAAVESAVPSGLRG